MMLQKNACKKPLENQKPHFNLHRMSAQLLNRNAMINLIFLLFLLVQIAPNLSQDGGYNDDNDSGEIPDWVYRYRSAGMWSTIIITLNGLWSIWMIENCRRSPSFGPKH